MAVAVLIGTLVAGWPVVAIVALALWVFAMTLASDLGPTAPGVSFVAVAIFVIALGLPTDAAAAGFRVAWFLVGCGWAVVVTSAAWPLRPDAPGRAQLAHTFTMIADFLRATPHDDASRSASRDRIASASKSARAAVVHGTRHGGGRGRRLLLALEAAADLERSLGALDRALDAAQPAQRELTDAVAALADTCDDMAAGVGDDDPPSSARLDGAMGSLADAPFSGPPEGGCSKVDFIDVGRARRISQSSFLRRCE
jgi:uncharacterized membrane protein YccC